MPTNAHKRLFNEMQKRSAVLAAALHRRRKYMEDWQERLDKDESSVFVPFKVNIVRGCEYNTLTKTERALCALFRAYLKGTLKNAYAHEYAVYLNAKTETWADAIHSVYQYLNEPEPPELSSALIFYSLFTTQTQSLASGKIRRFTFKPARTSGKQSVPLKDVQSNSIRRNQCNIMLFDYLLQLFPPQELNLSKFEFYAFSRYDWYLHYKCPNIIKDQEWENAAFDLPPNSLDGVDELGNLIRHNINFCIPNQVGWLTSSLWTERFESTDFLSGRILLLGANTDIADFHFSFPLST